MYSTNDRVRVRAKRSNAQAFQVDCEAIVKKFDNYWTAPVDPSESNLPTRGYGLGNTSSPALRETWAIMCDTYNRVLECRSPELNANGQRSRKEVYQAQTRWSCLGPATGTGKSEFAYAYLGHLAANLGNYGYRPGAILVCRSIEQCADAVEKINNWSAGNASGKPPAAVAFHSQSPTWGNPELLRPYQVVVMTQEGFKGALRRMVSGEVECSTWPILQTWHDPHLRSQPRALTIIDENLTSVCDQFNVSRLDLKGVYKFATTEMEQDPTLKAAFNLVDTAVAALEHLSEYYKQRTHTEKSSCRSKKDRYLYAKEEIQRLASTDPFDNSLAHLTDAFQAAYPKPRETLGAHTASELARTIRAVKHLAQVIQLDAYFHKKGQHDVVSAGRYILPDNLPGPCLLDATVNHNALVSLLGRDKASIVSMPKGARDYRNVTVRIARVSGTGMTTMGRQTEKKVQRLLADLMQRLKEDDKCLVVSHMEVEETLIAALSHEHGIQGHVSTAHWFAIDGRNDWNDHNKVVLFGLPYRPRNQTVSLLLAMRDFDDGQAYLDDERTYKLRRDIENKTLIAEVIQAINRVRCRRTVDECGNCAPVEVFVLLPNDRTGDEIEKAIKREMPGVAVGEWEFHLDDKSVGGNRKTSPADKAFINAAKKASKIGEPVELGELMEAAGLKSDRVSQDAILKRASNPSSYVARELLRMGAWTTSEGRGETLRRSICFRT